LAVPPAELSVEAVSAEEGGCDPLWVLLRRAAPLRIVGLRWSWQPSWSWSPSWWPPA